LTLSPSQMTSHASPRLSSHPPHQSWRQFDEKSPAMNSLSSTLKMIPTRGWLAGTTTETLPMHHHQKNSDDTDRWKGSPQHDLNFLTALRKAIRNILRSSEVLSNSTAMSRRASSLPIGRPSTRTSLSSSTLPTLPSVSTVRFVLLCGLWYASSALSSTTGKAILTQFRYPVTLTFVQFGFVAGYCLILMSPLVRFTRMRRPTRAILRDTLPMGCFQVGGHIFSSMAISRIPVSTTHTIKVRLHFTASCQI
jgi:solute carrier family 35, member E1